MGLTLNQRRFLETRGFNVEGWTYEQASAQIAVLKASPPGKVIQQPQIENYQLQPQFTSKSYVPKEKFEAHLSIEQVRTNALNIALSLTKIPNDERVLLDVAEKIEKWILTGQREAKK